MDTIDGLIDKLTEEGMVQFMQPYKATNPYLQLMESRERIKQIVSNALNVGIIRGKADEICRQTQEN